MYLDVNLNSDIDNESDLENDIDIDIDSDNENENNNGLDSVIFNSLVVISKKDIDSLQQISYVEEMSKNLLRIEEDSKNIFILTNLVNGMLIEQEDNIHIVEIHQQTIKEQVIESEQELNLAQKYQYKYYSKIIGAGLGSITAIAIAWPLGLSLSAIGIASIGSGLIGCSIFNKILG